MSLATSVQIISLTQFPSSELQKHVVQGRFFQRHIFNLGGQFEQLPQALCRVAGVAGSQHELVIAVLNDMIMVNESIPAVRVGAFKCTVDDEQAIATQLGLQLVERALGQ